MTILLVDDDHAIRELLAKRLSKKPGCYVATARDGVEGLHLFEIGAFDLVLTDYQMPNMDGVKMVTEIRQRKPAQWIILMTGNPAEAQRDLEGRGLSGVKILIKPFGYRDLEEIMQ
jgi:DNA-binding response OmpR family regulator